MKDNRKAVRCFLAQIWAYADQPEPIRSQPASLTISVFFTIQTWVRHPASLLAISRFVLLIGRLPPSVSLAENARNANGKGTLLEKPVTVSTLPSFLIIHTRRHALALVA